MATSSSTVAAPTSTSTSVPVAPTLPTSVKAIAAAIAVLGVIVFALVIWRIYAWTRRRKAVASGYPVGRRVQSWDKGSLFDTSSDVESVLSEPTKAMLAPARPASGTIWVPQIKPWMRPGPRTQASRPRAEDVSEKNTEKDMVDEKGATATRTLADEPGTAFTIPTSTVIGPSPKGEGTFAAQQAASQPKPAPPPKRMTTLPHELKLPRLVVVAHEFAPTMSDELDIAVDERVTLIEEFQDGWCRVARVRFGEAQRGVVPRFCLVERRDAISKH